MPPASSRRLNHPAPGTRQCLPSSLVLHSVFGGYNDEAQIYVLSHKKESPSDISQRYQLYDIIRTSSQVDFLVAERQGYAKSTINTVSTSRKIKSEPRQVNTLH